MVDTGRHPRIGFELQEPCSKQESVNEFMECMAQGLQEAKAALNKVKDEYAVYYNQHWEPAPVFTQGTRSGWMEATLLPTGRHLNCHTDIWACLSLTSVLVEVHTVSFSLPTSAISTQSSPISSCPLNIQTPSWADDWHYPHPQLSSTGRKSMRYWIAGCTTTVLSTWSNERAMMRVIINGRSIHSYTQSQR
jgi:hypothetical protein